MDDPRIPTLSVSDLLALSRPCAGAAFLRRRSPSSPPPSKRSKLHRNLAGADSPLHLLLPPSDGSPSPSSFSPIDRPVLLVGTVDLFPDESDVSSGCRNHCLSFSDGTSRTCCCFLGFDLDLLGREVHVLAWNFFPLPKHAGGGVLEVVRWSVPASESAVVRDAPLSREGRRNSRAFGVLTAVSPIFKVPRMVKNADSSCGEVVDGGTSVGFLAEVLTCACNLCCDRSMAYSLSVKEQLGVKGNHSFTKPAFVYFVKPNSRWHPVIAPLVGQLVHVSGLSKKLVHVGREESYLMLVSTANTVVSSVSSIAPRPEKNDTRCYSGVVTGVYMQGMAVELDEQVWLLVTDPEHTLPHSFRIGAIVSVSNFHMVRPRFSSIKMLLLGTCYRTSIVVKSFSPSGARCYSASRNENLLGKFLRSLSFCAKFWVLLLLSCLRKKFTSMLSDKQISGSKNVEGLAQTYAISYLPSTAFKLQNRAFMEFCKHDSCGCRDELNPQPLKLVVPISDLIARCEEIWCSMSSQLEENHEIGGGHHRSDHFFCRGKSYSCIIRRTITSDDLGFILLGKFKISQPSGRLQLVDATGSLDVLILDFLPDANDQNIYEVKEYKIILESLPTNKDNLQNNFGGPLSCRSLFQQSSKKGTSKIFAVYVQFCLRDMTCIGVPPHGRSRIVMHDDLNSTRDESFHLLFVTHKFPVIHNVENDINMKISSSFFAESFILPYNIFVPKKNESDKSAEAYQDMLDAKSQCIEYLNDTRKQLDKQPSLDYGSTGTSLTASLHQLEKVQRVSSIPCLLSLKSVNSLCSEMSAYLHFAKEDSSFGFPKPIISESTVQRSSRTPYDVSDNVPKDMFNNSTESRILLEFNSNSFSKYQLLRTGAYYSFKCPKKVNHCASSRCDHLSSGKVRIDSEMTFYHLSFYFCEKICNCGLFRGQSSGLSTTGPQIASTSSFHDEQFMGLFKESHGLPCMHLHVSSEAIRPLAEDAAPAQLLKESLPSADSVISVSLCFQMMMVELAEHSGNTDLKTNNLPQGTQISLSGYVENIHTCDSKSKFPSTSVDMKTSVMNTFCVHVRDDNHMVRIRGNLNKFSCPVGLGRGANATFYRVLMTRASSKWRELLLTPLSSIVINSLEEISRRHNEQGSNSELERNTLKGKTTAMQFNPQVLTCLDTKLIQFQCRVVTVQVLLLERNPYKLQELQLEGQLNVPSISIPLAGFLLDDGSCLRCCWADSNRAGSLLKLHEIIQRTFLSAHMKFKRDNFKYFQHTVEYYLQKMLKKHHRVVVQNHGAIPEFSSLDLAFSCGIDEIFSNVEERLLKFIVFHACHGSHLNVTANIMDSNALKFINMDFPEVIQAIEPIQHLWVREVGYIDILQEAKNILSDLIK